MRPQSDSSLRDHPLIAGALIGATISAVLVFMLYMAAVFGSGVAADTLLMLSLPKFNPFALLIPDELEGSRYGMEMMLGVSMLLLTTVFFAAWAFWIKLVKR